MAFNGLALLRLTGWTWKITLALIACNHLALMWPFFFAFGEYERANDTFHIERHVNTTRTNRLWNSQSLSSYITICTSIIRIRIVSAVYFVSSRSFATGEIIIIKRKNCHRKICITLFIVNVFNEPLFLDNVMFSSLISTFHI